MAIDDARFDQTPRPGAPTEVEQLRTLLYTGVLFCVRIRIVSDILQRSLFPRTIGLLYWSVSVRWIDVEYYSIVTDG